MKLEISEGKRLKLWVNSTEKVPGHTPCSITVIESDEGYRVIYVSDKLWLRIEDTVDRLPLIGVSDPQRIFEKLSAMLLESSTAKVIHCYYRIG